MAKIGNWGSYIKFRVSESKTMTFQNLRRSISRRTSTHNLIGEKPKIEDVGPGLQTVTLTVELNAMLGIKPRKTEETILRSIGKVAPLVIGGRNICNKAMLTKISSAYNVVLRNGRVFSMNMDLTFTEYN